MLRVYVETSVWGMVHPGRSPVLRGPTLEFFEECRRGVFQSHISDVVIDEIREASPDVQRHVFGWIEKLEPVILYSTSEANALAEAFIESGVLSSKRWADARHVACAVVHGLDLLVSWNYRHIANVRREERFHAVSVLRDWQSNLSIHTPPEVLEWK